MAKGITCLLINYIQLLVSFFLLSSQLNRLTWRKSELNTISLSTLYAYAVWIVNHVRTRWRLRQLRNGGNFKNGLVTVGQCCAIQLMFCVNLTRWQQNYLRVSNNKQHWKWEYCIWGHQHGKYKVVSFVLPIVIYSVCLFLILLLFF